MRRGLQIEIGPEVDDNLQQQLHLIAGTKQLIELLVHAAEHTSPAQPSENRYTVIGVHCLAFTPSGIGNIAQA